MHIDTPCLIDLPDGGSGEAALELTNHVLSQEWGQYFFLYHHHQIVLALKDFHVK